MPHPERRMAEQGEPLACEVRCPAHCATPVHGSEPGLS